MKVDHPTPHAAWSAPSSARPRRSISFKASRCPIRHHERGASEPFVETAVPHGGQCHADRADVDEARVIGIVTPESFEDVDRSDQARPTQ